MGNQHSLLKTTSSAPEGQGALAKEVALHLVYLDEVKYKPPHQEHFWLSAISLPPEVATQAEEALGALSEKYFWTSQSSKETEFHAKDIFHGHGPCKGWEIERRIDLFVDLLRVLACNNDMARIEVRVSPGKMDFPEKHFDMAFMFMVEKIECLMKCKDGHAIVFHDKERDTDSKTADLLGRFKRAGTPLDFGIPITRILDTAHPTDSSRSRFVQLADVHAFLMMLKEKQNPNYPARKILEQAKEMNLLWPTRYKHWPR
jgi:hypothetical protein